MVRRSADASPALNNTMSSSAWQEADENASLVESVWLDDDERVFVPAKVVRVKDGQRECLTDSGKARSIPSYRPQIADPFMWAGSQVVTVPADVPLAQLHRTATLHQDASGAALAGSWQLAHDLCSAQHIASPPDVLELLHVRTIPGGRARARSVRWRGSLSRSGCAPPTIGRVDARAQSFAGGGLVCGSTETDASRAGCPTRGLARYFI